MTTAQDPSLDPKKQGNVLIGERIHTLMWRAGRTQKQLAALIQVDQGSISNRLRGKTAWSAVEVSAVAAWLNVPVEQLLPEVEVLHDGDPPEPDDGGAASASTRAAPFVALRIIRPIVAHYASEIAA
jgi:transcriptional regulator with XRE-family HTH domain